MHFMEITLFYASVDFALYRIITKRSNPRTFVLCVRYFIQFIATHTGKANTLLSPFSLPFSTAHRSADLQLPRGNFPRKYLLELLMLWTKVIVIFYKWRPFIFSAVIGLTGDCCWLPGGFFRRCFFAVALETLQNIPARRRCLSGLCIVQFINSIGVSTKKLARKADRNR